MKSKIILGGQAVIDGVMIKSNNYVVTSVISHNGQMMLKKERLGKNRKIQQIPFIRGIFNMYEMLFIGYKSLLWSAHTSVKEKEDNGKIGKFDILLIIALSLSFAVSIFLVLPFIITKILYGNTTGIIFNAIDGLIRITIFILYIFAISRVKDIKRLFQYHGAEHKAVNCYEAGDMVNLDNVWKFSTIHPRCGTNFIVIVLLLSIFLFSFITTRNIFYNIALRIILIPLMAAVSYEVLKFSDKHNSKLKLLILPGSWLQRLTTDEPNKTQLKVAINSVNAILKLEGIKI